MSGFNGNMKRIRHGLDLVRREEVVGWFGACAFDWSVQALVPFAWRMASVMLRIDYLSCTVESGILNGECTLVPRNEAVRCSRQTVWERKRRTLEVKRARASPLVRIGKAHGLQYGLQYGGHSSHILCISGHSMAHQIEDVHPSSDEEYDENADEDFNPEAAAVENEDGSSSDEEETAAAKPAETAASAKPRGRKRKSGVLLDGDLDSGDEATIRERQSKKRRRRKDKDGEGGTADADDDSAGEGGLIKTRAQRLAEQSERKQRKKARDGEVTVDIEGLWEELSRIPVGRISAKVAESGEDDKENDEPASTSEAQQGGAEAKERQELITIKRNIEYAGEVTEIEERVPRTSKVAQQYLASHPEADPTYRPPSSSDKLQRPLKRPSIFEPNPLAQIKGVAPERLRPRAPSRLDVVMAEQRAEAEAKKKAEKMTTVQKSALDWQGFVNQQGLREELDEYGKSKKGFLAREEFLGRAEYARDVAAREARMKG